LVVLQIGKAKDLSAPLRILKLQPREEQQPTSHKLHHPRPSNGLRCWRKVSCDFAYLTATYKQANLTKKNSAVTLDLFGTELLIEMKE
jgi:hypothetical protein